MPVDLQIDMLSSMLTSARNKGPGTLRQSIQPLFQPDRISPALLLLLSSFTIVSTGLAVVQYLTPESSFSTAAVRRIIEAEDAAPFLASIRTTEGQTFTRGNIAKAPWLYGAGHILPA